MIQSELLYLILDPEDVLSVLSDMERRTQNYDVLKSAEAELNAYIEAIPELDRSTRARLMTLASDLGTAQQLCSYEAACNLMSLLMGNGEILINRRQKGRTQTKKRAR